jgi:hypothetical protein
MSRGLGNLQRLLYQIVRDHRHEPPMTFAQIRMHIVEGGARPWSSLERSARRAIAGLVREEHLVAIGGGGVTSPYHYCIHPGILLHWDDAAGLQVLADFQQEMREAGTPVCIASIQWAIEQTGALRGPA